MSAPLILTPFSVPFEPSLGSYALLIPATFRNHTDSYSNQSIKLMPGVSHIRFTWDGIEAIRYRIGRAGVNGTWVTVIEQSPGLQTRSSRIVEIALTEPAYLFVQTVQTASATSINAQCRAGALVIPTAGPQT